MDKNEIEENLKGHGDYVKIDYLTSYLRNSDLDLDTRRFVLIRLAGIYEIRRMFCEAGRLIRSAAEINSTDQNKINDYIKSGELFIKAGKFDEGDVSFNKAFGLCTNEKQIDEIKISRNEFYKIQAVVYLTKDKRKHAVDTYERVLTYDLSFEDRKKIQKDLLELYEKLGKIKEYYALKRMF